MNLVRAAVVQDSPVVFNRKATLEKVHSLVRQAAEEGAKLVVLPEAFVSAYPSGLDFGARMGSRTPEGREDFRRYYESAVDVPGPGCEALGKAARDARVFLVIGVIERDGGTLYCTVLFFSPDGGFMGKHRKLMPTAMERLVWGFGDGSTLPVFDTPLGKIGSVICWENYMPMLRMHMFAQVLLCPNGRLPGHLASLDAAHCSGRTLLRPQLLPVSHPGRLSGGLCGHPGEQPGYGSDARRELHHRPPGSDFGRAKF